MWLDLWKRTLTNGWIKRRIIRNINKNDNKQSQADKKDGIKFIKAIDVYRVLAKFVREYLWYLGARKDVINSPQLAPLYKRRR